MNGRRVIVVVVFAVVLGACTSDHTSPVAGDGVLDCDDGQVRRSVGIERSGATEEAAVAAALRPWTDQGGELVALPPDESWMAVLDG